MVNLLLINKIEFGVSCISLIIQLTFIIIGIIKILSFSKNLANLNEPDLFLNI